MRKRLSKIIIPTFIIHTISVIVSCIVSHDFNGLSRYIWELIALYIFFYILIKWVGECSFEIFLIHFKVIDICKLYIENELLFSICVIAITIILAIVLGIVCRKSLNVIGLC